MKKTICTLHIFSDNNQSLAAVSFESVAKDGNTDLWKLIYKSINEHSLSIIHRFQTVLNSVGH